MSLTSRSDPKQNPWYPRHVSDRVEELIEDLDTTQCQLLYDELHKVSIGEWFSWIEEQREEIAEYDGLTRTQRKHRLSKATDASNLRLHHACIFVELWRARLTSSYFHLPPNGASLDTEVDQRRMMLAVMAAYNDNLAFHDLWPFEYPEDVSAYPFRDNTDY